MINIASKLYHVSFQYYTALVVGFKISKLNNEDEVTNVLRQGNTKNKSNEKSIMSSYLCKWFLAESRADNVL